MASMSSFEDLLLPGSIEFPDCRCGTVMRLFAAKPRGNAEIRVFKCESCRHELQLMVWGPGEEKVRSAAL